MARPKKVNLSRLETFIRRKLKGKLRSDLRQLRVVKEADLECAAYFFVRRVLESDNRWRVLARKHARRTARYIDMLIFRRGVPRIAIEFKWNHPRISGKDRQSLQDALKRLGVNKAYYVSAVRDSAQYAKMHKRQHEKYSLHECVIGLDLTPGRRRQWEKERKHYTTEMGQGKAHH